MEFLCSLRTGGYKEHDAFSETRGKTNIPFIVYNFTALCYNMHVV